MATQLTNKLATAQDAINLPEVQEMVKRLAAYNLGVFMPHMHDENGNMEALPEGIVQVEDEQLRATFRPADDLTDTPETTYLPVGWRCVGENSILHRYDPLPHVQGQQWHMAPYGRAQG